MLPAAAASVKIRLGSDQNAGMYAFSPASARVNRATVSQSGRRIERERGGDHQAQASARRPGRSASTRAAGARRCDPSSSRRRAGRSVAPIGGMITSPGELFSGRLVPLLEDAGQEELDAVAAPSPRRSRPRPAARPWDDAAPGGPSCGRAHACAALCRAQFLLQGIALVGAEPGRLPGPVGQLEQDQDPQDHRRDPPGDVHPLPALEAPDPG